MAIGKKMKMLFIGDIVGKLGRRTVAQVLPDLRRKEGIEFVLAQAENVTHGRGAKLEHLRELMKAGVDFFTAGPHIFYLDPEEPFSDPTVPIIRSYNLPPSAPGLGFKVVTVEGRKIAILSLLGLGSLGEELGEDERNRRWLNGEVANPFEAAPIALGEISSFSPDLILVDFHAEWTSEKRALGFFLDGKVSVLAGTHQHVPSADPVILPKGTAYVTDLGMVGARDSVLGVEAEIIISRLASGNPLPFKWVERGPAVFNSVLVEVGSTGPVSFIKRIDLEVRLD